MKHLLLLSVLLLGVSWAVAQDPASSGQNSPSSAGQSTAGQAATGSQQTVQGCLSGSEGKYTLTDKQGTTYSLTGDTSKLAEHVGHEVKVTGSTGGGGSASAASAGGGQTLEVASVKHVAKSCPSGGMSK